MPSIQETLYAALAADPTVAGLVDDRIYPGQLPDEEEPSPFVYFAVPETVPVDQLDDGAEDVRSELEFHALADTYAEAGAVIAAIRAVVSSYRGGGVKLATWAGTSEEITDDGYHHAVRFVVWWNTGDE